jgi:hypothetical protein
MRDRLRVIVLFLVVGWLGLAASSARAQTGAGAPAEAGSHSSATTSPTYDYLPHQSSSALFPSSTGASNDNTFGVAFGGFILACAGASLVFMIGAGFQHVLRDSGRSRD